MPGKFRPNPRRVARVDIVDRASTAVPVGHWFALTLDDGERYLVALPGRTAGSGIQLVRLTPRVPAADGQATTASRVNS